MLEDRVNRMIEKERTDALYIEAREALAGAINGALGGGLIVTADGVVEALDAFIDVKLALAIEALASRALEHKGEANG